MLYAYYDLKTKRDYEDLYQEIDAWVSLEQEEFDFGEGLMRIEGWYGSEDTYYEMDLQSLDSYLFNPYYVSKWDIDKNHEYWDNYQMEAEARYLRNKPHKSYHKKRERNHLEYLYKVNFWSAGWSKSEWVKINGSWEREYGGYLKRYYAPPRAKYLRNVADRKIRHYTGNIKSGAMYRKIFDYWWELY